MPIQTILPDLDEEEKVILEPEKILEIKTNSLLNRVIIEYLVKWKNLPVEDSTCKDDSLIHKDLHLTMCLWEHMFESDQHVKP